jgi:hypothetical protein
MSLEYRTRKQSSGCGNPGEEAPGIGPRSALTAPTAELKIET